MLSYYGKQYLKIKQKINFTFKKIIIVQTS